MPSTTAMAPSTGETASPSSSSSFIKQMTETGKSLYAQRRPWSELIYASHNNGNGNATPAFSKPESFADAVARIRRHVAYFRINYALIVVFALLCSLIRDPGSLFVALALSAAWSLLYFFRREPLVILDRSLGDGPVLAGLIVVTILALFLTGVTGTILTAVAVGLAVVLVHAAFRVSDDLFLDEEAGLQRGLLGSGYTAISSSCTHAF